MKNCNVFIVHTEYHVLLTVNIICNQYLDYDNHVYVTLGTRINKLNEIPIPNVNIHLISNNTRIKDTLKEIIAYKPERLFFYQDNGANNMYLCYNLSKAGTTIALVQDGLKPYVKWNKRHEALSTIKDTLNTYYHLIKQHAFVSSLVWMRFYDYGDWQFTDELWLTNPNAFINRHNKKLVKIPEFSSKSLSILNAVFDYNGDEDRDSVVLILGQPTVNRQNWSFDAFLVESIVRKFPQSKVWYKPHPLSNLEHLQMIGSIKCDNFFFYKNNIPAELLILQLKNSIVVSRSSTAMLTYNDKCKYYWTYPMFPKDVLSSQLEVYNPTSHIIEINSIDEITF